MIFPIVTGQNLEYEKYNIPYDLEGDWNLVIIPFKRWQQNLVDQWSFFLNSLEKEFPNFRYYEVPTLSFGYKIMRFMIDGGMRAGIPDHTIRARTITLYLNKTEFKKSLDIQSEKTIYILLIDKQGTILWRSEGKFDLSKGNDLRNLLINYTT